MEHHFLVIVTSYPSRKVKARAEQGWYPGLWLLYKQKTVYHGYSAAKARAAFYRALLAAQKRPLTIYVTVLRDGEIYLRAKPESWDT